MLIDRRPRFALNFMIMMRIETARFLFIKWLSRADGCAVKAKGLINTTDLTIQVDSRLCGWLHCGLLCGCLHLYVEVCNVSPWWRRLRQLLLQVELFQNSRIDAEKSQRQEIRQLKNGSNTKDSQTVTHSSTNLARRCLTSVFGREPVFSTWYGRYRQAAG